jgi:antitoxin PrlF
MTYKVGTKGQVVIPKSIRDRIGIRPGDQVVFDADGDQIRIRRADHAAAAAADRIKGLRGLWSDGPSGTEALIDERRSEREREERKAQGRGVGRL